MAWSICTRLLVFCCCVLVAAACGDSNANISGVAVTVFAPSSGDSLVDGSVPPLSCSLEYQVSCGASVDDRLKVEGTLEPGPCAIQLRARDADGTPLCSAATSIELLFGGIAQVHVVLPCSGPDI